MLAALQWLPALKVTPNPLACQSPHDSLTMHFLPSSFAAPQRQASPLQAASLSKSAVSVSLPLSAQVRDWEEEWFEKDEPQDLLTLASTATQRQNQGRINLWR